MFIKEENKTISNNMVWKLKQELYATIPESAGFDEYQTSIVKGLLFDAVDEAMQLHKGTH